MTGVSFTTQLEAEYDQLWNTMERDPKKAVVLTSIASRLLQHKDQYREVSRLTGVPMAFVAAVHQRESSGSFARHLHNGDPLTARTIHVPAGRPKTGAPPFTWIESAVDALMMPPHSLHKVVSWTSARLCYEMEKYNGFGYRLYRGINSPYLWSGTNHYRSGKYVADGKWDANAVDAQMGTVPIVVRLMEMDFEFRLSGVATQQPTPTIPLPRPRPSTPPSVSPVTVGVSAAIAAAIAALAAWSHDLWTAVVHFFGG